MPRKTAAAWPRHTPPNPSPERCPLPRRHRYSRPETPPPNAGSRQSIPCRSETSAAARIPVAAGADPPRPGGTGYPTRANSPVQYPIAAPSAASSPATANSDTGPASGPARNRPAAAHRGDQRVGHRHLGAPVATHLVVLRRGKPIPGVVRPDHHIAARRKPARLGDHPLRKLDPKRIGRGLRRFMGTNQKRRNAPRRRTDAQDRQPAALFDRQTIEQRAIVDGPPLPTRRRRAAQNAIARAASPPRNRSQRHPSGTRADPRRINSPETVSLRGGRSGRLIRSISNATVCATI